jgi:hypothetical protein
MCCCLVQSCCCGWQTLEHGLFIFAVFDIFWNLVMVCFSILVSNAGIAGLNGLLILTDVGLAFGAKQGVRSALLREFKTCTIYPKSQKRDFAPKYHTHIPKTNL